MVGRRIYRADGDKFTLVAGDAPTVANKKYLWPRGLSPPVWPYKSSPDTGYGDPDHLTLISDGKEIVKIKEPITEENIESHVVALGLYAQAIAQGAPEPKLVNKKILKAIDAMIGDVFNYGIGAQKVTVGIDLAEGAEPVEQAKVDLLSGFDPTADSPAGEAARAAYRTFARILRLKVIEPRLADAAELVADKYDK